MQNFEILPNRERYCRLIKKLTKNSLERNILWRKILERCQNDVNLISTSMIHNCLSALGDRNIRNNEVAFATPSHNRLSEVSMGIYRKNSMSPGTSFGQLRRDSTFSLSSERSWGSFNSRNYIYCKKSESSQSFTGLSTLAEVATLQSREQLDLGSGKTNSHYADKDSLQQKNTLDFILNSGAI